MTTRPGQARPTRPAGADIVIADDEHDHPEDVTRQGGIDATGSSYGTRIYPYSNIT